MKSKKILLVGAVLTAVGILVTGTGVVLGGQLGFYIDRAGVHTSSRERKAFVLEKEKLEEVQNISMDMDYADINFIPSDGFYLEYRLYWNAESPRWKAKDGSLVLEERPSTMKLNFFSGIDFASTLSETEEKYYVNLYYPEDTDFKEIQLVSDDGDINTGNLSAENLFINCDYGDLKTTGLQADNLKIELDDGDWETDSVDAGTLSVENDYGNVKAGKWKADRAEVKLNDGNFEAKSAETEEFSLKDDYGNVKIGLSAWEDVTMDLATDYGSILLPRQDKISDDEGEASYRQSGKSGKELKVLCSDGNIEILD